MNTRRFALSDGPPASAVAGFTLIELMISMVISLLMLAAMIGLFVNTSRNNIELQKMNGLIESGRFTMQLLQTDLSHAGYWGGYVPQFDDLTATSIPGDVPNAVPDVCTANSAWNSAYRNSLLGIPVATYDALPVCLSALPKRAGTDVLVIRHADTCVPGIGNCEAENAQRLYMQSTLCTPERHAGYVTAISGTSLTLSPNSSAVSSAYVGMTLRMTGGPAAGQVNSITAYNGATKVATLSQAWAIAPSASTDDTYAFEYVLGTGSFPLHNRDCVGTGAPATLPINSGTFSDKRQFISNVYYVHDYAHPDRPGEFIPTLVRSSFDATGGTLAQQPAVPLIEGVEQFRVELGIDNLSDAGTAVDYSGAVVWADPNEKNSPTNRGDGEPDQFIRCLTATPCTPDQLMNVVAAKIYVLVRSREPTVGYVDDREYCLGATDPDGTCPVASTIAAANDNYKRHVFRSSVRLVNVSARRETP